MNRILMVSLLMILVSACQTTSTGTSSSSGPSAAPDDAQTFDGSQMRGYIDAVGCRKLTDGSTWKPDWNADYTEGKIVGSMITGRRDNEPAMQLTPQNFSLPVGDDGTFGASSGDGPHRLWLRWWASSSSGWGSNSANSGRAHEYSGRIAKYQWVSGKVSKNGDIYVHVRWGTTDGHGSCDGEAYFKKTPAGDGKTS